MNHTHKMVNGVRVALTASEIAAITAEEALWDLQATQHRRAQLQTEDEVMLSALLVKGTASELEAWVASRGADVALKTLLKFMALRFL